MPTETQPENTPLPPETTGETIHHHLSFWNSLTLGFAMVSPVVGLYAIMGVQTRMTGGGWLPALALCLAMQLLVAC